MRKEGRGGAFPVWVSKVEHVPRIIARLVREEPGGGIAELDLPERLPSLGDGLGRDLYRKLSVSSDDHVQELLDRATAVWVPSHEACLRDDGCVRGRVLEHRARLVGRDDVGFDTSAQGVCVGPLRDAEQC